MTFSSAELIGWIHGFLWPLFRIGAMMTVAPIFATKGVPTRVRLAIAVAVTLVALPLLPDAPRVSPLSLPAVSIIVQQLLIGVAMGFALTLVFNAIITGGQVIALKMGLGFASMVDPTNGQSIPVISQFYVLVATLLFLVLNGHLVLIELVIESFRILPIGATGLGPNGFWELVSWSSRMFAGAVWIALPVLGSLLVANVSFGVMARAAQQLNIFVVGMPMAIIAGFFVMVFTLPTVVSQFTSLFNEGFELIGRVLRGGQ